MVATRDGPFAQARDALSLPMERKRLTEGFGAPLFSKNVAASV